MASKGPDGQAFAPVLSAVATMQGNVSRPEKAHAHEFLEKFQKSVRPAHSGSFIPLMLTSLLRLKHGRSRMPCYKRPIFL
jgi:hypothetical protein